MRNEFLRHPAKAGVFQSGRGSAVVLACALLVLALSASVACAKKPTESPAPAPVAAATDAAASPDAADAADAVGAPMACGEIAAARYPFLTCVRGESGRPVFASVGEPQQAGQLEIPSKFVRGKGYWGPSGLE